MLLLSSSSPLLILLVLTIVVLVSDVEGHLLHQVFFLGIFLEFVLNGADDGLDFLMEELVKELGVNVLLFPVQLEDPPLVIQN